MLSSASKQFLAQHRALLRKVLEELAPEPPQLYKPSGKRLGKGSRPIDELSMDWAYESGAQAEYRRLSEAIGGLRTQEKPEE